jgi:glutamine cyclotransferase
LYESAGGYGRSQLQFRALASNTPTASAPLNPSLFAEGLSILNHKLYQLTWKSGKALVYDPRTLKRVSHFNYQGQGWGLCNDGSQLIMSNGTSQLQFINPENFTVSHRITVRENGKPISWINELEWVNGYIYANVWQSNRILIINPKNGHVEAYVDLSTLLPVSLRNTTTGVLNGIAYHKASQKLYVTGKNWPKLYQIQLNRIMSR